jgi:hypothetical protein
MALSLWQDLSKHLGLFSMLAERDAEPTTLTSGSSTGNEVLGRERFRGMLVSEVEILQFIIDDIQPCCKFVS